MSDIQEFDFSVNLLKAILWQYDGSPNLKGLLDEKDAWYVSNQTEFWDNWITDVFDLRTANSFGLGVWSIILNQSLYSPFAPSVATKYFGFGVDNQNFGTYNFATATGGNNVYSVPTARLLLQLRYFQLISSGTVPETNRMLEYLFGTYGGAYLVDNLDMTQTYMFNFAIPAEMSYMLLNTDILPRPAGVSSEIIGL